MFEYFILTDVVTFQETKHYIEKINSYSLEELLIISKLFVVHESKNKIELCKEDLFHINEPEKIKIKNVVKSAMYNAVYKIITPLTNISFESKLPYIDDVFLISLDGKLIVGATTSSSIYYKNPNIDSSIAQILLIKNFLL